MQTKHQIRQNMINQCKMINHEWRRKYALDIIQNLNELIKLASNIAIYNAYGFEFDLSDTIKYCLSLDKNVYQPIAYKELRIMRFAKLNQGINVEQEHKIFYDLNDEVNNEIEWYNIDLVFMPLVAVSKGGDRLGKGGGYYDATFAKIKDLVKKPILCGIGFDLQLVNELPHEEWDIKLDYFISEKRVIKF